MKPFEEEESSGGLPKAVPAIYGALAVALGAFGAHIVKPRVSTFYGQVWETAAMYHLIHSCVLFGVHIMEKNSMARYKNEKFTLTGKLMVSGVTLFSGSLYALVLSGYKEIGIVTPIGGSLLIAGWASLLLG